MFIRNSGNSSSLNELVLFAFDDVSLPWRHGLRLQLSSFRGSVDGPSNVVIGLGGPGMPDNRVVTYFGTVRRVHDELWMWYVGAGDKDDQWQQRVCPATSQDGRTWARPNLGLVEYNGATDNNLVDLVGGHGHVTMCLVFHEPDDPNPERQFKMMYHDRIHHPSKMAVAFSPDGLRWNAWPGNPVGPFLEPIGGTKMNGAYLVNGQGGTHWSPSGHGRRLVTRTSYDFETWTEATSLGLRRDPLPPRPSVYGPHEGPQVHLGASLWNRGNILVGFYGMWNGHPSNDRRLVWMNIGLVVSTDGLHFREPIPDFPIIEAMEVDWQHKPHGSASTHFPALMQGQGFENIGDETLSWYAPWPEDDSDGIRVASWPRDRLGWLEPFLTADEGPHVITAVIDPENHALNLSLNVDGISAHSHLKVSVLDEQFQTISGYGPDDLDGPILSGLNHDVRWNAHDTITPMEPFRLRFDFGGVRPEDVRLYAAYLHNSS